MSSIFDGTGNVSSTQGASGFTGTSGDPVAQDMKQAAAAAVEFQIWVSKQATTLSKLKVFHTMAKQVNDQQ